MLPASTLIRIEPGIMNVCRSNKKRRPQWVLQHCVQQQQSVLCTGAPGPTGQMETTPQQHGSSTTPRRPCKPTKTNPPGYPTRTTATHLQEDVRRQQQGGHVYCVVLAVQLKSAPYRP